MAIRLFIFSLLILTSILLTITIIMKQQTITKDTIEKPTITFINSTMYEINTKNVSKIIQSQKALHYKTKDELHNATVILRSNNKDQNNSTDTIIGKYMLQKQDQLTFKKDVIFNRNNELVLNTQYLTYNIKTQIGKNHHKFKLDYLNNTLTGNILYFDGINDIIMANNAKFKIQIEEKR
ncbi:MAG: LPS export ABC transporter periplasmic protein LptC [Arcobacteraceae bacterium]|nr:LPS export ABC transporter periplasmic protein LptC [Arcobacteraceae bacterium]